MRAVQAENASVLLLQHQPERHAGRTDGVCKLLCILLATVWQVLWSRSLAERSSPWTQVQKKAIRCSLHLLMHPVQDCTQQLMRILRPREHTMETANQRLQIDKINMHLAVKTKTGCGRQPARVAKTQQCRKVLNGKASSSQSTCWLRPRNSGHLRPMASFTCAMSRDRVACASGRVPIFCRSWARAMKTEFLFMQSWRRASCINWAKGDIPDSDWSTALK